MHYNRTVKKRVSSITVIGHQSVIPHINAYSTLWYSITQPAVMWFKVMCFFSPTNGTSMFMQTDA